MKKLFLFLTVVITLTACDNASGPSTGQTDSAAKAMADTLKATADTAVKKIDSTMSKAADSVKSRLNTKADSVKRAIRK